MSARDEVRRELRQLCGAHQGPSTSWDQGCNYCDGHMAKIMAVVDRFAKALMNELESDRQALDARGNFADHTRQDIFRRAEDCGCDPDGDGYEDDHPESEMGGEYLCRSQRLGSVCCECEAEDGDGPFWRPDRYEWPCPVIEQLAQVERLRAERDEARHQCTEMEQQLRFAREEALGRAENLRAELAACPAHATDEVKGGESK